MTGMFTVIRLAALFAGLCVAGLVAADRVSAGVSAGRVSIPPLDGSAMATGTASRGARSQTTPPPPAPLVDQSSIIGCDAPVVQSLMQGHPLVSQWIVVISPSQSSTQATLQVVTVVADRWTCTVASSAAMVGRSGIRPLINRRSGDGSTPSGVFPLGVVSTPQGPISLFGNRANPGVRTSYRSVQAGDCYGANPNTSGYGHWRVDPTGCLGDDELLTAYGSTYEYAALIGANTEPNVSGDSPTETPFAAAIFLHRNSYTSTGGTKPTAGCVSVAHSPLLATIRAIDPTLNTHFAIGTRADLLAIG